ncbi:MAG TPA: RNA polymerase sigma factor, partial [Haliangium sp.]|nr:RNA polymerase sigma factor [Haliangium sp.]
LLPRLFRLCVALTGAPDQAEDLLQVSLLKAYQRRRSYEGRGTLSAWLAGIIRHENEEIVRKSARRRSLLDRAMQEVYNLFDTISSSPPPNPETWVCSHEQAGMLLSCVHELPEPYRTIIWLCDIEELSYEEVAEMVNIPVGTVKSRHARGRQRLKRSIERREGDS